MGIPGSAAPLLLTSAAAGGYQIERSLRFNSADSATLSRVVSSAGNRATWTFSVWVKRGKINTDQNIFGTDNASYPFYFKFDAANTFTVIDYFNNAGQDVLLRTNAVYRDPSAWYHIVFAWDTTQSVAADRLRLYINGEQVTSFSSATYPAQNTTLGSINSAITHRIGRLSAADGWYFDGYLADVHFIDGQALDPTSFGEFDATTGVWNPKAYTGTYGTNGFRLPFSDNSAATATTLGKDSSGNGNNWTPNNLSVTAGAGNDSLVDSPTNYGSDTGAGGQVRGNYATFSPLAVSSQGQATLANGNLDVSGSGTSYTGCVTGLALSSGKWYWEYTTTAVGSVNGTGIIDTSQLRSANGSTYGYAAASRCWYRNNLGQITNNSGAPVTGLATFTNNDVVNVAVDFDAGKLWFGKNGTWDGSGNPATGANASITFTPGGNSYYALAQGYGSWSGVLNAGARAFAYTAPSGFKALCTQNLPTPTITKGNTAMDVVLYTGNGSTQSITTSFSPDLVWIKERSDSRFHALCDSVRGDGLLLYSNSTLAEQDIGSTVVDLTSTGFNLGFNSAFTSVSHNWNSVTHVAWAFDAGSSTVTNTAGTISSQVRANASAGFSVVTYTGTGANATVGHGLGVAPQFIIVKARSAAYNWQCYHASLGAATGIQLNLTNAAAGETTLWNSTAPTSTVFSVGTSVGTNESTKTYVGYCFAPVAGYSAFGSYTGNGSADGPFVFCNFRPRWILIKRTDSTADWYLLDAARVTYNAVNYPLHPNLAKTETDTASGAYDPPGYTVDFLSNGFKIRNIYQPLNISAGTFVWAAFAENPFSLARAR